MIATTLRIINTVTAEMSKKDTKGKKVDPKEEELQRLAEEARRLEEVRRLEEENRYRERVLPTGLRLTITEWCISELWASKDPRTFLTEFLLRPFSKEEAERESEGVVLPALVSFHLDNLVFAKAKLNLDNFKSCVLVNIFGVLVSDPSNFSRKTLAKDAELFKKMITDHTVDHPPRQMKILEVDHVKEIMEYFMQGYAAHFDLFQTFFGGVRKGEEMRIAVYVDVPLAVPSLSEAEEQRQPGSVETRHGESSRERTPAVQAKLDRNEEELKAGQEGEAEPVEDNYGLDEKTLEIIREKLREREEQIEQQLQERKKLLEEKIEALLPPAKPKK
eukprot:TRINITY_DN10601_c0_g1_i1.p1 TRINITY_DN10601_c0_g1~~TRINITY_DN10601_c0_g1_i1.p1  ORF type:complete len:333 (-),score=97.49 TRINITY_DN10601_c0_g1_i1:93-1091(-)